MKNASCRRRVVTRLPGIVCLALVAGLGMPVLPAPALESPTPDASLAGGTSAAPDTVEVVIPLIEDAVLEGDETGLLVAPPIPGGAIVPATGQPTNGGMVTVTLDDVPVTDAIRMFTQISGANIIAGTNVAGRATVRIENVHWKTALEAILDTAELVLVERSPGIFIVKSRNQIAAEPMVTDAIELKYTTVGNIMPVITSMLSTTNASAVGFPDTRRVVVKDGCVVGLVFAGDIEKSGIVYNLMKERIDVSQFAETLVADDFGLTCLPEEMWRPQLAVPDQVSE